MIPPTDHEARAHGSGRPRQWLGRPFLAAATLVLGLTPAACASRQLQVSSGSDSGDMFVELNTAGGRFNFRTSTQGAARSDTLPETPEKLWPLLGQVYEALSIPVKVRNEEARVLGSVDFDIARRLGDHRLSLFLDCGSTITGSMADQGEVTMTVATQVRPATLGGDHSEVTTLVKGTARQHGLSSGKTDCTTTGRLEDMIVTRLQLRALGKKG